MKRYLLGLILLLAAALPAAGGELINSYAGAQASNAQCVGQANCFAIDFTAGNGRGAVTVNDSTTAANRLVNVPVNGFTFNDALRSATTGSNISMTSASTTGKNVTFTQAPFVRSTPHNLLLQSQTMDVGTWSATRSAFTGDATTAPDGTTTAEKFSEDATATQSHFSSTNIALVDGLTYTFSVYVKSAGQSRYLALGGGGIPTAVEFPICNPDNGTIDIAATSTVVKAAGIIDVGNGWYRCYVVFKSSGTTSNQFWVTPSATDNTVPNYSGDGSSGFYVWGAQLSKGAFLHPYHVTVAAAWIGVPIGYDTSKSKFAMQIEPTLSNVLLRSEELDNAYWGKTRSTVTADATTAPDGLNSADKIVEDATAGATHIIIPPSGGTITASSQITCSGYLKAAERTGALFLCVNGAGTVNIRQAFNLSNCTTTGAGATTGGTFTASSVESIGNGWCRVSVTGVLSTGTAGRIEIDLSNDDGTTTSYNGDGTSGLYAWGTQIEGNANSNRLTSYIQTSAATVQRIFDVASLSLSSIPWSATVGSVVTSHHPRAPNTGANSRIWRADDTTANELIETQRSVACTPDCQGFVDTDGGVSQVNSDVTRTTAADITNGNKVHMAWAANDLCIEADGNAEVCDTSGTIPTPTQMLLGDIAGGGRSLDGFLFKLTYVPTNFTGAQMQARTAATSIY